MLPSHYTEDGRPLVSASAVGTYLKCPASHCLLQLVAGRRKESKVLQAGTNMHQGVNTRLVAWLKGEAEAAWTEEEGVAAVPQLYWEARAAIQHFAGAVRIKEFLAEERLTSEGLTCSPDFAFVVGHLLVVIDWKKSLDDPHLPQAGESPQLLVQAGMLLTLWAPARNCTQVAVGYVTPDGPDWAPMQDAFDVLLRFEALRERFAQPPRLEFNVGPHCGRCSVAHVCPRLEGEPVFDDLQLLSNRELGEAFADAKARAKGIEAKTDELDRELRKRIDAGTDVRQLGWRLRQDSLYNVIDPVRFLRDNGVALESVVPALSRSKACQILAEKLDRPLTEAEVAAVERKCTQRQKAAFLFPVSKKDLLSI